MTRKKVKLAYISNDSARKATFKKRKKGFLKKMYELTTLCEIEACAIIYSPYETQPEAWPNAPMAQRVLSKFRRMPEMEKSKKMVNQEGFVRQRINKTNEQLKKQQKENREKEVTKIMHGCLGGTVGVHNLCLPDLNDLGWLIDRTLKDISKRNDVLKKQEATRAARRQSVAEAMPPPPPPPLALPQTEEVGVHDGENMMQQSQSEPQDFDNMNQLMDPQEPMPMRGTWFMDLMGAMGPHESMVAGFGGGASGGFGSGDNGNGGFGGGVGGFGGGASGGVVFGVGANGNGGFGSGAIVNGGFGDGVNTNGGFGSGITGSSGVFGGGASGSFGGFGGGAISSTGYGGGAFGNGGGFGSGGGFSGGASSNSGGFSGGASSSSGGFGSGASSSGGFGGGASGNGGVAGENIPMTFADYSTQNLWSNAFFP